MKLRKTLSTVLAALMLMSVACANSSENDTASREEEPVTQDTDAVTEQTDVPERTVLTVLTHRVDRVAVEDGGDGSLAEMTRPFEEANNCIVRYSSVTDYASVVSEMVQSGNYTDVLMIPDSIKLVELENYFEPLGDYETLDQKYNCANQKMYNGTVYGLSHICTILSGICYNKRIWNEAGITELPVTAEEFIKDLRLIRDKTDAIPYYTNYKDGSWTLVQWQNLVISASGDPAYQNDILINSEDLFVPGGAFYEVYKLMYDIFSDPTLIENDPKNTDWENCKARINSGEIAAMVMGSWAVSQFAEAGDNYDDIGYMPVPFTYDNRQFAQIGADYCLGINKNIPDERKELGKKYITWFSEESGFAEKEGGLSTLKKLELPPHFEAFNDCFTFFTVDAPEGLVGVWDEIDNDSGLGTNTGEPGNFKLEIAAAAIERKDFSAVEDIFAEWNKRWAETRDANPDYIAYKESQLLRS